MKKITVPEIIELRDKLKGPDYYQPLHRLFEEDDKYYELDFRELLKVPDQFLADATVLPTGRQLIDVYTDHVDLANARVSVSQKSVENPDDSKAVEMAEEEADLLAKFGRGILFRSNVEEDISQFRVAAKHQGLYGMGCIKTVYDADRWLDKPEQGDMGEAEYNNLVDEWRHQRDSSMPIVIQAVNPLTVYPDPSYGGRGFVIQEQEKVTLDVRNKYPRWSNPKGRSLDERVTLTSWWDPVWRCELADDQVIVPVHKHKYGIIPYVFIESGLGNLSYDAKLEKRYVGILRYLKGVLISESRNFSLYDVAMKKGALPWYTAEGDMADSLAAFKTSYGEVVKLPAGVKLAKQLPDLAPDAVMRQVEIINSIIMAFAAPRATQGLGEQGVRSAAHARTLADLGGVRFQYPSESFRNKASKILSNCALIYKNRVPDDMRLWARTPSDEFDMVIDKKKLHPPFTFYVEFAPYSEEKEYTKHDDLERLLKSGIAPLKWVRKQMSNMDWKAMEAEDHKNMVAAAPEVQTSLAQMRATMVQEAIQRKMTADNIKATPPAPVQMAPQTRNPMAPMLATTESGRSVVAPSSPKPMPGSSESMDLKLKAMRGPNMSDQGRGGGGS